MKKNCMNAFLHGRKVKKWFLMMKLTMLLFLAGFMQVSATVYSQATKFNFRAENKQVVEVLKQIEQSSDFRFFYIREQVDVERKVTVRANGATVEQILDELFAEHDISYKVMEDNLVLLSPDENIMKMESVVSQQQNSVSGVVTDTNNQPLPGATVAVKGTAQGTVTNADGKYSIQIPTGANSLIFSFIGMQSQEISIGTLTEINVILTELTTGLDEVIVVGYGTQKKVNLTGAVDIVNSKQIGMRAVTNITEALQGMSPNLNITATALSSEPGGKMNMNIRGVGSLTGDYSPYILVDGVPMDINSINSNDIESMTILKDAAASAIYGARAPYGVILITTKKGTAGKVTVEYSNNISFSSPIGLPHLENALNYMTAHDQSSINAGLSANFTPENYERTRKYMAGEITDETWLWRDGKDWYGNGIWSIAGNANNDWMYQFYDQNVMRQKHDINVRGGGEKNSYFISAGLWDQDDELHYGDQFYKRYNVTGNVISKATDWLTLNLNTKYISENTQYFNTTSGWDRATQYHNFFRTNVFRPRILPNGEFSNISNIPLLNGGKENHYGSEIIVSLGAKLEPVKDWVTDISYNYKNQGKRIDNNQETVYGTDPNGNQYVHAYPISSYQTTFSRQDYSLMNIVSSYEKTVDKHYFMVMVGAEAERYKFNSLWGQKTNIITPSVPSISTSTGQVYVDDTKTHYATQGFFGRINYNYQEKYLLEVNARYDGSSKFEEDTRWGFFPSFSAGYNISKEDFWSSVEPYVNNLKIRGSWGSLGNQNVPNYLYLPTMGIGTNLGWMMGSERPVYTTAPGLVSANLTWETSTTANIGFDATFLKNRLTASFDVYNRITSEMFGPAEALPRTLGTSAPRSNNATLKTSGFELMVEWKDFIGDNISYNIRATLSDNISTVTEYNNPTKTLSTWYEGAKLGEIWGLETVGIFQSNEEAAAAPDQKLFWPVWGAGDIQYKDIDDDKKITRGTYTADNSGDYSVIGNNTPRYLFGLNGGMEWNGFDFSMFWQGVLKRDFAFSEGDMTFFGFNGHQWWGMNVFSKGDDSNIDYWRPSNETNILGPNTDAYYAKPYLSQQDYKNKKVQTRYMQNAAYLRLKNITVGYTIPANISQKIAISRARVYIAGENLITITSLTKLFDPEALSNAGWGVGKVHFLRKVYSVGLNITF